MGNKKEVILLLCFLSTKTLLQIIVCLHAYIYTHIHLIYSWFRFVYTGSSISKLILNTMIILFLYWLLGIKLKANLSLFLFLERNIWLHF